MSILNSTQEAMQAFELELNTDKQFDNVINFICDLVHDEIWFCLYEFKGKRFEVVLEELYQKTLKIMAFSEVGK